MNFVDAIAEGDGNRIIRCWKYLLLHFYAEVKTKYAIEAQYLPALPSLGFYPEIPGFFEAVGIFISETQSRDFWGVLRARS